VYDREKQAILAFNEFHRGQSRIKPIECRLDETEKLDGLIGERLRTSLADDIELLDGAGFDFDIEEVRKGRLSPVFFGSALNNFGVEPFLESFLHMTMPPLPRVSEDDIIDPFDERFSAFVFKIQANMNKAHRDRIAFIRVVSGKFTAGMEVFHVQGGRNLRLTQPQQMMAEERKIIDEAYAGDIIGIFDPGIFHIGDSLVDVGEKFRFGSIPTFAPDHFARVKQTDTMKRKQFTKGIEQIALEGAVQIFKELDAGMEEIIVGAVGVLQFDVLKFRMDSEYHVEIGIDMLPYEHIRWIENPEEIDPRAVQGTSDMKRIEDLKGNPLLLFVNPWSVRMVEERNPRLKLSEFGNMEEFR
jgi:peptide chain release factor 3